METSTPQSLGRKPRVLSIASPSYAGEDFVSTFQSTFDLHVSSIPDTGIHEWVQTIDQIILPSDRKGTAQAISDARKSDGPFEAVLIGMGNGGYERFDEGLLGPLLPELKIVASVNAGYSEFDMEWFNKEKRSW